MAKKKAVQKVKPELTIEGAVALHFQTTNVTQIGEALGRLLRAVKKILKTEAITAGELKSAVRHWVQKGYAKWYGKYLRIADKGNIAIRNIARAALPAV